jgi:aminoglycoside phosphotransferase family enzyme/predicted kinase
MEVSEAERNFESEILAFLARPESFGAAEDIRRIDTHAAAIFLAGERAYKLKRAVRYSYLDFSTLERREAACRAELRLNRRTAPQLYLGLARIVRRRDGALALAAEDHDAGETLDWLVVMRRFADADLLDRKAETGPLAPDLLEALSVRIAAFHAAAAVTPDHGGAASVLALIDGNDANLRLAPADFFAASEIDELTAASRSAAKRHAGLIEARRAAGKVRRCHGDLHLGNICLFEGEPLLFDCLEFNEALASIDVLYDLAFLLMDLRHRRLDAAASRVFNLYLDAADESDGLPLLPLFLSLRAAIRAHVAGAKARHGAKADRPRDEARAYLALAQQLLAPPAPRLVAIGGLSGTGKSTLARALAPHLGGAAGARLLHTDAIRKRLFGVAPTVRLPATAYGSAATQRVYEEQRRHGAAALAAGCSVIADAVFAQPEERQSIAAVAASAGVPFTGLWLEAPSAVLRQRIASRRHDMSDADTTVLDLQLSFDLGDIEWHRIDAAVSDEAMLAAALSFTCSPPQNRSA